MKKHIFYLTFLFVFAMLIQAQVAVKYNGYRQLESTIAIHPTNSNILATAVMEYPPSGRQSIICISTNNGVSWTQRKTVLNAADPVIDFDGNGNIFFSYLSRTDAEIYIIKSSNLGLNWTSELKVSNAGSTRDADKEWLTIDRNTNNIYLVWMEQGISTELKFSKSTNSGTSFTQPVSLVSAVPGVFSPFIATGNSGSVYITYAILHNHNQSTANFDLKFLKSANYGSSFAASDIDAGLKAPGYFRGGNEETYVLKYVETNGERSFRIYGVPSMAVNKQNGNIYMVVNHREEKNHSPGLTENDYSDLMLYRSTNQGVSWTQHRILDWEEAGEDIYQNDGDQYFPSITCSENGNIYILFYNSLIEYSNGNLMTKMSVAYSSDHAENFGVINVDDSEFDPSIGSFSAYNFTGDYIEIKNTSNKISFVYTKPHQSDPHHILFYHSKSLDYNITVYNDVNNNNTLGDIYVDEIQYTNLPRALLLNLNDHSIESPNLVNEWKFYKWQSALDPAINESRIKKEYFVADINKTINSKFEKTTPLTVRNYFEGGNGGTILFGEKNIDVINRNSPYTENAFIFQQNVVEATYRAEANQSHNLFNTTWNFWSWENGSANRIREAQINQTTPIEWRANYKSVQRSDDNKAYSNNSQRKFVRTDDGWLHNVYSSMGRVFYEAKSPTGNWQIMNGGNPIDDGPDKQAKLPSIDYAYFEGSLENYNQIFIVYQEKFGSSSKVKVKYFHSISGGPTFFVYQADIAPVSGNYDEINTTPVVGSYNGQFTVVWKNGTGQLYARSGIVNLNPPNDGIQLQNANPLNGTTSNSINPSIYSSKTCCTWIKKLAWEELSGGSSSIKFATIIGSQISGSIHTPSLDNGYTRNYNPSVVSFGDDAALCWIAYRNYAVPDDPGGGSGGNNGPGDPQPLGETKVFFRRFINGSWTQPASYGNNINSVSINRNSDNSFAFAWSEGSTSMNIFVRSDNTALVYNTNTTGAHIQVGNFNSLNTMRLNSFKNKDLPYYFTVSQPFTIDQHEVTVEREGVIVQDTTAFYFALGEISVDGQKVDFIIVPDTLDIENKETLNTYLLTEPFLLTNSSSFVYSVKYGITDSLAALLALSNGGSVRFRIELIDEQTSEVLGTFDDVTYTSENIIPYENIAYQVNTEGIGSRSCRLRLVTDDNLVFDYSLIKSYNNESMMYKKGLVQRKLEGQEVIKTYELEQNYPNPFNPSTTIRYQIPKEGMVTLKVYDILGAEVATLVNEEKIAGRYEVNFDASGHSGNVRNLASGVYIYRLQTNDYISVKKMIMLK